MSLFYCAFYLIVILKVLKAIERSQNFLSLQLKQNFFTYSCLSFSSVTVSLLFYIFFDKNMTSKIWICLLEKKNANNCVDI